MERGTTFAPESLYLSWLLLSHCSVMSLPSQTGLEHRLRVSMSLQAFHAHATNLKCEISDYFHRYPIVFLMAVMFYLSQPTYIRCSVHSVKVCLYYRLQSFHVPFVIAVVLHWIPQSQMNQ